MFHTKSPFFGSYDMCMLTEQEGINFPAKNIAIGRVHSFAGSEQAKSDILTGGASS